MLVVDRFRPINRLVKGFMVALGVVLGLGVALTSNRITPGVVLFVFSLITGGAVTLVILLVYKIYFYDGVPKSPISEIISPDYYGNVAMKHFAVFAVVLVRWFATGLIFSAISAIA